MTGLGPSRGAQLPYRVLAGVVPYGGGWLAATAKLQGITLSPETPQSFKSLLEILDYKPAFSVIALFAPIGLLVDPRPKGRKCDQAARSLLGMPRASAIVSPPVRRALGKSTYADAVAENGGKLSPIAWKQFGKVAEVDLAMEPYWQRTVFEVHAELSFFQIAGDRPLRLPKHTEQGREERRALLRARFPEVDRILNTRVRGVSQSQLLDAAACLWTARRIAARAVSRLPEEPEWDTEGLRMEIVR